jgi:SAM-dependent methyltransferase
LNDYLHNVSIYNHHVPQYVQKFMDLGLYRESFNELLNLLPPNASILELGCGPGNVVKYLKSRKVVGGQ